MRYKRERSCAPSSQFIVLSENSLYKREASAAKFGLKKMEFGSASPCDRICTDIYLSRYFLSQIHGSTFCEHQHSEGFTAAHDEGASALLGLLCCRM